MRDVHRLIGDTLADYIEERGPLVQSTVTFEIVIRNLVGYWGDRLVSEISEASCHAYYVHRAAHGPLSNATVGRELRILRAAVNRDFDMGRIARRVKVWIKRENHKRSEPPSRREVLLAARRTKPRSAQRRYILIAFYTGGRKGAVLGLRWSQISSDHIDFNQPGREESNKRRVMIPMHRKLRSFIRLWRQAAGGDGPVIHRNQKAVKGLKRPPRSLRAAAAVHMLQNGVSVYDVAKWLGNSVEMIERHYGHYTPDHFQKVLAAWDGHLPADRQTVRNTSKTHETSPS
jgi:integrase